MIDNYTIVPGKEEMKENPNLVEEYLSMSWFSVESVLPTKSWVSAAGLGTSFLGHEASGQQYQCWQARWQLQRLLLYGQLHNLCHCL